MARFRDLKTVSVFGNSWTGVQDISVDFANESWDYSADDDQDLKRVDVSKQKITFSINVLDPLYKRDIKDPAFGASPQTALNEVQRCTASQTCDVISDSAEDDQWITYIGVTKKKVECEVEFRDISQSLEESTFKIGDKGTFSFKVLPGASTSGLANGSAYELFTIYNATIVGIGQELKHGDLATTSMSFRNHGDDTYSAKIYNTLSGGGNSGFEVNAGDTGTVSFVAPSVSGSGGDKTITISNVVCTSQEITANHAGQLERKYTFEAYSSDGSTSPLALT